MGWYENGNGTRKENRTLHFRTRQSQQTAEVYLLPARRQHFSIAAQTKRHLYGPGATLRHRNHQHRHQHPALLHFVVRRQQPPLHPHRMLQRPPYEHYLPPLVDSIRRQFHHGHQHRCCVHCNCSARLLILKLRRGRDSSARLDFRDRARCLQRCGQTNTPGVWRCIALVASSIAPSTSAHLVRSSRCGRPAATWMICCQEILAVPCNLNRRYQRQVQVRLWQRRLAACRRTTPAQGVSGLRACTCGGSVR